MNLYDLSAILNAILNISKLPGFARWHHHFSWNRWSSEEIDTPGIFVSFHSPREYYLLLDYDLCLFCELAKFRNNCLYIRVSERRASVFRRIWCGSGRRLRNLIFLRFRSIPLMDVWNFVDSAAFGLTVCDILSDIISIIISVRWHTHDNVHNICMILCIASHVHDIVDGRCMTLRTDSNESVDWPGLITVSSYHVPCFNKFTFFI